LRRRFRSDRDGTYHFKSVVPKGYQIATDGPVGESMRAPKKFSFTGPLSDERAPARYSDLLMKELFAHCAFTASVEHGIIALK